MCPGNNESAGKRLSGRTRHGDPWLSGLVTECGWAARRAKNTYLAAQFCHIAKRRGQQRAAVTVGYTILNIAWHLLTDNTDYNELGHDHFERRRTPNPDRERQHLTTRLEALGYTVTLEPIAA